MKLTVAEKFGTSEIQPQETINFVKAWFHPDDTVLITLIPTNPSKKGAISLTLPATELAQATGAQIEGLAKFEGNTYGIYFGINPLKEDNRVSRSQRGGKADVKAVYGVWADLDVKPGAFQSRDDIYRYLDCLVLEPSLVVENGGSGGVHAYWKMDKPESPTTDLPAQWWAYLVEKAQGRDIDRLADSSRLMRLPGAVYYPKEVGGQSGTVKVVRNTGNVYTRAQIEELAARPYEEFQTRRARTRANAQRTQSELPQKMYERLQSEDGNAWSVKIAKLMLEEKIKAMTWDEILIPAGWTLVGEGDYGKRHWARPGSTSQSGNTDWQGSEVLSLHSWSTETGLADLKEAGVPLTKETVLLRLHFDDNVEAMVNALR